MPLVLGLPLRRMPSRVYHASLSKVTSPVLVSRVPMAVVSPLAEMSLTVMLYGSSSSVAAALRVRARALLGSLPAHIR